YLLLFLLTPSPSSTLFPYTTLFRSMTITLVSVANASVLCATRILYAMSRDGWGSVRIAYVNRGGTPTIPLFLSAFATVGFLRLRSEEHTSELQSHLNLVCRLLLEKK